MMNTTHDTDTGRKAYDFVVNALAQGRTIYISTMTRITKVTPKNAQKWAASGRPFFKVGKDGALLMVEGRSYVRLTSGPAVLVGITAR